MNLTVTANITTAELEKIIKQAAEAQMPSHKATKVVFKVNSGYDDRFTSSPPSLSGVDVTMEPRGSMGVTHRGGMDDR